MVTILSLLFSEVNRSFEARRLYRKYRTRQLIENRLGGIADEQSRYACASNRAHDDKIRPQFFRQPWNHLFGRSPGQVKAGREVIIGIDAYPFA